MYPPLTIKLFPPPDEVSIPFKKSIPFSNSPLNSKKIFRQKLTKPHQRIFIYMITNNLNRKENIQLANLFVKSIEKFPVELIRIQLSFDYFDAEFSSVKEQEIINLTEQIPDLLLKNFQKKNEKIGLVLFPDFDWDSDQFIHKVGVNYILVGYGLKDRLEMVKQTMNDFVKKNIGGDLKIVFLPVNSSEDLFLEIFPVQFEAVLRNVEWFFSINMYPSFYSRSLFNFLIAPLKICKKMNNKLIH